MSRPVIALALACYAAFWVLLLWAPIGVVAGLALKGRLLLAIAAGVACIVAAFVARALGNGIFSGHRIAYIVLALSLAGVTLFHIYRTLQSTSAMAVLAAGRAVVFFGLFVLVVLLTIRKGAARG